MALNDKAIKALKAKDAMFKVSDGGGMYLMVRPHGTKLWQMGYRFGGKQRTLSIGIYPDVGLADARDARDAARKQLARGIDPHAAHMIAAAEERAKGSAKTFGDWADGWLEKERAGGNIAKTMDGKTHKVSLLKAKFGKLPLNEIARDDVLAFLRSFEDSKKLETRDRVRAIGEKIFNYANVEEGNPFRPFDKEKLVTKVGAHRPALTTLPDAARLFKIMAIDRKDTLFDDLVGLALRFLSLTAVRPGEVASAEWSDIDIDAALWTIPASKMKMGREHVVPLSRQALAVLARIKEMTGERRYVFSCGKDAPLSESALAKRLRFLGYDTKTMHCPHGYRSTFSTLLNGEETEEKDGKSSKFSKTWDSDLIELQLAHIQGGVKAIYNRGGPTALLGSRRALMQHWADKIDGMVKPTKPDLRVVAA
jgi:integrase